MRLIQVCHTGGSGWVELAAHHWRSSQPWAASENFLYSLSIVLPYITVIPPLLSVFSELVYPSVTSLPSDISTLVKHHNFTLTSVTSLAIVRSDPAFQPQIIHNRSSSQSHPLIIRTISHLPPFNRPFPHHPYVSPSLTRLSPIHNTTRITRVPTFPQALQPKHFRRGPLKLFFQHTREDRQP